MSLPRRGPDGRAGAEKGVDSGKQQGFSAGGAGMPRPVQKAVRAAACSAGGGRGGRAGGRREGPGLGETVGGGCSQLFARPREAVPSSPLITGTTLPTVEQQRPHPWAGAN